MPRKPKQTEQTQTTLTLDDAQDTPLVALALEHELTRAKQYAKYCKDKKKRLFHEFVRDTYQRILNVINSAE